MPAEPGSDALGKRLVDVAEVRNQALANCGRLDFSELEGQRVLDVLPLDGRGTTTEANTATQFVQIAK